jgi:hypothetical protein
MAASFFDISESGLAMRAARSLADGELQAMRFQLSESQTWIETRGTDCLDQRLEAYGRRGVCWPACGRTQQDKAVDSIETPSNRNRGRKSKKRATPYIKTG